MAQNSRSVMLLFIIINDMESELSTKKKIVLPLNQKELGSQTKAGYSY